jgi:DNA-binding IscR family transcriptional regulator
MAANTRLACAVQILCVIAYKGPDGTTSQVISRSLQTNPVVVRRLLKDMQKAGLVAIRPGKDGGVHLIGDPDDITLARIHHAIEPDPELFALRPEDNMNCAVGSKMRGLLTPIFAAADTAVQQALSQVTLGQLARRIA